MATKTAKGDLKNQALTLDQLYGIDLENGTITAHPSIPQPKEHLREDVMESLVLADNPTGIPPIEVFLVDDGTYAIVDGYHRVQNAINRYLSNPKENTNWLNIRATRLPGDINKAALAAVRNNLDNRSNLTDAEVYNSIKHLLDLGFDDEELNDELGGANKKYVKMIREIQGAVPVVGQEVQAGNISMKTAAAVAKKVDKKDQAATVRGIVKRSEEVGERQARIDAGVRKSRRQLINMKDFKEYLATFYTKSIKKYYESELDDEGKPVYEIKRYDRGQLGTLIVILGLSSASHEEQGEAFAELYAEWKAEKDKAAEKAASKKKQAKAAKVVVKKKTKKGKKTEDKPKGKKGAPGKPKAKPVNEDDEDDDEEVEVEVEVEETPAPKKGKGKDKPEPPKKAAPPQKGKAKVKPVVEDDEDEDDEEDEKDSDDDDDEDDVPVTKAPKRKAKVVDEDEDDDDDDASDSDDDDDDDDDEDDDED